MSDFRDRLRRRLGGRERPVEDDAAAHPGASVDVARLRARLERTLRRQGRRRAERAAPIESFEPVPPPVDLATCRNAHGTYAERVREVALATRWGGLPLAQAGAVDPELVALWSREPRLADASPEHAAFLDTETSSLSGGAGTIVFLIGVGLLRGASLRVHQVFLNGPGEERAALERVRELLAGAPWLVSFHGKAFDRHRIHARFALHGLACDLLSRPHLDLLHVGKRLWGSRLERARLKDFERELLGFERIGDLPGAACPRAWFDHVRGAQSAIGKVFEHNLVDVVTLVGMTAHLASFPGADAAEWCAHAEALAHGARPAAAAAALERMRAWFPEGEPGQALHERRARLARRLGRADLERESWEPLAALGHAGACEALARLAERDDRDPALALRWCRSALALEGDPVRRRALERRQRRLEARLERRS